MSQLKWNSASGAATRNSRARLSRTRSTHVLLLTANSQELKKRPIEYSKKRRNGLIYIPTGGGKALIGGTLAVELANTAPTVMFQPGKEILEQNLEKIESYGFKASVMSASMNRREIGDVTLATIGTAYK